MRKLFLTIFFCLVAAASLWAAENPLGLDDAVRYDIYLNNYQGGTLVLKSLDIVVLKEIHGRQFLVIRTDNFAPGKSEGLIAFDSVLAILPALRYVPMQTIGSGYIHSQ